jgi:hypothetical protein
MSTTLISAWIIGFVIKAEPLPTGAIRLALDNGQIGIVENPQSFKLSYLLEPSKQDGLDNDGVAFKKNEQDIIMEIRRARVRIGIRAEWEQASSSPVLSFYRHHESEVNKKLLHQKTYLSITTIPTPTPYELHPTLSDFTKFSHIAEDATKNVKPVDIVMGDHPLEIIYIQYSQSVFKNPPGSFHRFSDGY